MLGPDCVCEALRGPQDAVVVAQPELGRIAVADALLADVDPRVEDGEVGALITVEVRGHDDRLPSPNLPVDQIGSMLERSVLPAAEDLERRRLVPVFRRAVPGGFLAPPGQDVVAAVVVEVGDGEYVVEPPHVRIGFHVRERRLAGGSRCHQNDDSGEARSGYGHSGPHHPHHPTRWPVRARTAPGEAASCSAASGTASNRPRYHTHRRDPGSVAGTRGRPSRHRSRRRVSRIFRPSPGR